VIFLSGAPFGDFDFLSGAPFGDFDFLSGAPFGDFDFPKFLAFQSTLLTLQIGNFTKP
jgi:hypothetical protein